MQEAQQVLLADRATCEHPYAGPKDLRCPSCQGIMRRCCQSTLSYQHEPSCPNWHEGQR